MPFSSRKTNRGEEAGPLVAVDEWLVLRDVECIGSGHREQVRMRELAAGARLRHGHGGLQESTIADARRAAVPGELLSVDEEDVLEVEEDRIGHLASFRRVPS